MALCENCRAELEGGERLPEPWFDYDQRTLNGNLLSLTEWQVLEILWRRRRRGPVSTESLITLLYDDRPDDPPDDKIIAVWICHLRRKLAPTPFSIKTHWGAGYQFLEHKDSGGSVIADIEDGVPLPLREARPRGDKYGITQLQPGQSRRIDNAKLANLRTVCYAANKRGLGQFTAGYDRAGAMRIWRLE